MKIKWAAGLRLCRLFHYGAARRVEHWNHWVEISTGRCATVARTLKSLGAILRRGFAPDQRKQRLILTVKINTARGRFRAAAARNPGAHDTHLIDFRTKTVDARWLKSLGTDRCPPTARTPAKYRIRTVSAPRAGGPSNPEKVFHGRGKVFLGTGKFVFHTSGKMLPDTGVTGGGDENSLIAIGGGWGCKREVVVAHVPAGAEVHMAVEIDRGQAAGEIANAHRPAQYVRAADIPQDNPHPVPLPDLGVSRQRLANI